MATNIRIADVDSSPGRYRIPLSWQSSIAPRFPRLGQPREYAREIDFCGGVAVKQYAPHAQEAQRDLYWLKFTLLPFTVPEQQNSVELCSFEPVLCKIILTGSG